MPVFACRVRASAGNEPRPVWRCLGRGYCFAAWPALGALSGLRSEAPHTHSFGGFGFRQIDFAQSLSTSLSTAPAKPMPWRATSCPWRGLFHLKFTALAVVRKVTIRPSPSRWSGDGPGEMGKSDTSRRYAPQEREWSVDLAAAT